MIFHLVAGAAVQAARRPAFDVLFCDLMIRHEGAVAGACLFVVVALAGLGPASLASPPDCAKSHRNGTMGRRRWCPMTRCIMTGPTARRAATILTAGLLLWFAPVAFVAATTGTDSVYTQQGLSFSGTAVVTLGGAYAVLARRPTRRRRLPLAVHI
jgi:hypothetical protein